MKTHTTLIYHCVHCGRLVHAAERESGHPQCCGHAMAEAAETATEGDGSGEKSRGLVEKEPSATKGRQKPR